MDAQSCYICGTHFSDKVRLGMHIQTCYEEAVHVRKELWHPHPLDIMDEQRYTEYMRKKFDDNEAKIRVARGKNVSFVTMDSFEAMRNQIPATSSTAAGPSRGREQQANNPRQGEVVSRGCPGPVGPPCPSNSRQSLPISTSEPPTNQDKHGTQLALPVRQVSTGVTMLRHELADEIAKLKLLREAEEHQALLRQQQFDDVLRRVPPLPPAPTSPNISQPGGSGPNPRNVSSLVPVTTVSPPLPPPSLPTVGVPSVINAVDCSAASSSSPPMVMPDGRLQCPHCGKLFGRKGFAAHFPRCGRPAEDFTFSRDMKFEQQHPERVHPFPAERVAHREDTCGERETHPVGGEASSPWTQFMITYPRPILEEKPKTAQERNKALDIAKQKKEMEMEMAREMGRGGAHGTAPPPPPPEAMAPCPKCGRNFFVSCLGKHEAVCNAKPKK